MPVDGRAVDTRSSPSSSASAPPTASVHFDRVHDIYISQSSWLISFIVDMADFGIYIDKIDNEFTDMQRLLDTVNRKYEEQKILRNLQKGPSDISADIIAMSTTPPVKTKHYNVEVYLTLMDYWQRELQHLKYLFRQSQNMHDNIFDHIFTDDTDGISRRSWLPFLGDALSTITGTATKKDLQKVESHIDTLERTQQRQAHVLKQTLSLINITNDAVRSNRYTINQLVNTTLQLNKKIDGALHAVDLVLGPLFQYNILREQLRLFMDQLEDNVNLMNTVLNQFIGRVKSLAMGIITPDIVLPSDLRRALGSISAKLPNYLSLPKDYRNEIFEYYKFLKCRTVVDKDRKSFYIMAKIN